MTALSVAVRKHMESNNTSLEALAKAAGVSSDSLRGVIAGRSTPNATTVPKYAKMLGVSAAEVRAMSPRSSRQRHLPAHDGRIHEVVQVLRNADALLSDDLALAVHRMSPAKRATLQAIVAAIKHD